MSFGVSVISHRSLSLGPNTFKVIDSEFFFGDGVGWEFQVFKCILNEVCSTGKAELQI